jgi:DNA repair photolyase
MRGLILPQRLLIKPQAQSDPATAEILRRVQALDPDIPIVRMRGQSVSLPQGSSALWKWKKRKASLVLSHRVAPFLTTFPSPGAIVERMGVNLNLAWHCPYNCHFCYLQAVRPTNHLLYTNLDRMREEVQVERFAYPAALSLWSILSFAREERLDKVPKDFSLVGNQLRARFQREGISSHEDAIDLLFALLQDSSSPICAILQGDDAPGNESYGKVRMKDLRVKKSVAKEYYDRNRRYPVRLNATEFTDLLALDPLCGYSREIVRLVNQYPELELGLRTKSAYVDELLTQDGCRRVGVAISFDSAHAIKQYQPGTASLEERIHAARCVQEAKGFRLRVSMEPMIKYPGYERDYERTVHRIMKELDPTRIEEISMSCVRYSGRVMGKVMRNFPDTDLFDESQGLVQAVKGDRRRYPLDERVRLYRRLHAAVRKHTDALVRLGAETPAAWDVLGWDRNRIIERSVYQYPG